MPQPPRPNIRCRRSEGQDVPAPGTVVEASDGRTVVYVGDEQGLVDLKALAPRLRTACEVTLIGDMWGVAKPLKQKMLEAWSAATRAAREASRPPAVPKPLAQRCGRPRTDGQPCRQWAGAGTDSPGSGPCAAHGGPTVQKAAEARRLVEQAETVARLAAKARQAPLTPRERVEGLTALRDLVVAAQKPGRRRTRPA